MDNDAHEGNAITVWIADPEEDDHANESGEWTWNNRLRRKLAVIKDRSLEGIYTVVKAFLPADKCICEIRGFLLDPAPPTDDVPADWSCLNSDEEVKAFLQMTKAEPVRLLVILHRSTGANTPPLSSSYFALNKFQPLEEYNDPAEDSDALRRDAARVGWQRMPLKDHTFEERKLAIRRRIARQEALLATLTAKHYKVFPDLDIVDDKDPDWVYIKFLTNPRPNTGHRIVKAWEVIPVGYRAWALQDAMGVPPMVATVRAIWAAQYAWEQLNAA